MILSIRHKFIFIKGYKVAGTSIEIALSQLCGPQDIVTPILPVDERMRLMLGGRSQNYSSNELHEEAYSVLVAHASSDELNRIKAPRGDYYNHMPLAEVIRRCREPISDFRIVCAERSPYAKMISWLNMNIALDNYGRDGEMRGDPSLLPSAFDRAATHGRLGMVHNIDRYRGLDGRIDAHVLRYERLQADFDAFVRSLGVPSPPELPHAKRGLMSDALDPRQVLRRDQLDAMNDIYSDEFEFFGYRML